MLIISINIRNEVIPPDFTTTKFIFGDKHFHLQGSGQRVYGSENTRDVFKGGWPNKPSIKYLEHLRPVHLEMKS
jgi:hypothetical protein